MAKKKEDVNRFAEEFRKWQIKDLTRNAKDEKEKQKLIKQFETDEKKADKAEEKRAKLRSQAKPKAKLIMPVDCTVEAIVSSTYTGSFTPESEVVYGGRSPKYGTGNFLHSEITVTSDTPIRKIEFDGWPNIQCGDTIRAYFFKGKKEYATLWDEAQAHNNKILAQFGAKKEDIDKKPKYFYVERQFKEKETTHTIEKLVDGQVVATYVNK